MREPASPQKIVIGADHAGYTLKEALKEHLRARHIEVIDVGCHDGERVDYPCIAQAVVEAMRLAPQAQGILCCGSGVGVSIAANRYPTIRAVLAHEPYIAEMARRHNDANVLCLGGRMVATPLAGVIVDTWLDTPFEGGRHEGRVRMLDALTAAVRQACKGD